MIEIEIRFKNRWIKKRVVKMIPEEWSEITGDQLMVLVGIQEKEKIDELKFIEIFTGIKKRDLLKLDPYFCYKISRMIDFLTESEPVNHQFLIKKIKKTELIADHEKLKGISFGQFIFCENYYTQWINYQDKKSLDYLVASLYFKKGEDFNENLIERNVIELKNTDETILNAIAFNYSMNIRWLQKRYPIIFKEQKKNSSEKKEEKFKGSEWIKIFESIVGDDLIHRDEYAKLPIHTVLKYLTRKYIEEIKN